MRLRNLQRGEEGEAHTQRGEEGMRHSEAKRVRDTERGEEDERHREVRSVIHDKQHETCKFGLQTTIDSEPLTTEE